MQDTSRKPRWVRRARRRWRHHRDAWADLLAGRPLATTASPAELERRVALTRPVLERILLENILPFWNAERIVDDAAGGYRLNHDQRGVYLGDVERYGIAQSRIVWFFAYLHGTPYGRPEHLDLARGGFEYMRDAMWDAEHGGFYWKLDPTGRPTQDQKHVLAQCFALFALAEYARATDDPDAHRLAHRTFELLEDTRDPEHGGFARLFARDWSAIDPDVARKIRVDPGIKQANEQLHVLEGYTAYYRLAPSPLVRDRILELVEILLETMIVPETGQGAEHCLFDWTPIRPNHWAQVFVGHDLERIWMAIEAMQVLGEPIDRTVTSGLRLFDACVRHAYDARRGGFYERGPVGRRATERRKAWWLQAEALPTSLWLFDATREARCAQAYLETLDWIVDWQVDWEHGEWHAYRKRNVRRARSFKASQVKTPYHNGRAMLLCLATLDDSQRSARP